MLCSTVQSSLRSTLGCLHHCLARRRQRPSPERVSSAGARTSLWAADSSDEWILCKLTYCPNFPLAKPHSPVSSPESPIIPTFALALGTRP
jgi:hypothetical protein